MFHFVFVHYTVWMSISDRLFTILVLPYIHSVTHGTDYAKYDRDPGNHDWLWKVLLHDSEAQLAECLREPEGIRLE